MQTNMRDATVTTERRKEQRKRPLGLVYVELSPANGGMLRDLSEQGFAMRAMMPLRPGDTTPFAFSLDPETRLEGQCKVLWVEEDGRVAGLEFTEIHKDLPETVREWLLANSFVAPSASPIKKPTVHEASTLQELREELRSIKPNSHSSDSAERRSDQVLSETPSREETRPIPVQTRNAEPAPTESSDWLTPTPTPTPESTSELPPLPTLESRQIPVQTRNAEPAPIEWDDAFTPTPPRTPAPTGESTPELAPLPTLESLFILPESSDELAGMSRGLARTSISLAIRMMIVLALLAGTVVFHRPFGNALIWLGHKIAGSDAPEISYAPKTEEYSPQATPPPNTDNPSPPVADATNSVPAGTESAEKTASPAPANSAVEVPPVTQNTSPQPAKNQLSTATTAPAPLPATDRTTTFSPSALAASEQAGQQEYLAAQDILKDKKSASGMSEAVRLLWVAVEKGNSSAEITLAELYRTGHGVAKSCDQTRILLTAATKKGNSEAQKHLDQFLKEGCE